MLQHFLAGAAAVCGLSLMPAPARAAVEFDGSFGEVTTTDAQCGGIFAVTDYHATHAWAGPTGRISVLKLQDRVDQDHHGFFNDASFVGLYGPDGDVDYQQTIAGDAGSSYDVHISGLVDWQVIYLEAEVTLVRDAQTVCKATATYSGFN